MLPFLLASLIVLGASQEYKVAQTAQGNVRGIVENDCIAFKGVRYANPITPPTRWEDPTLINTFTEYDAVNYRPACPQTCTQEPGTCPTEFSDDCLFLNVYTPVNAPYGQAALPVMFFIHGGNYKQGGPGVGLYQGNFLANFTGHIIVTTAYRLGPLGFLVHPLLPTLPVNLGIKDQRLALKWVQQNIAAFGGNPQDVTIFGQSAGGGSVLIHYTTPYLTRGLFKAVVQESNPVAIEYKNREQAGKFGRDFTRFLGCDQTDSAALLECMRSASMEQVITAEHKTAVAMARLPFPHTFEYGYPWSPTVGTEEVPDQPLRLVKQGQFNRSIPFVAGFCRDDALQFIYGFFPKPVPIIEYDIVLSFVFGLENSKTVLSHYGPPKNESRDTRLELNVVVTDYCFACSTRYLVSLISQQGGISYFYNYSHSLSFDAWGPNYAYCEGKVCHASEIPILFNSASTDNITITAAEELLARRLASFWTQASSMASQGTLPGYKLSPSQQWKALQSTDSYEPVYILGTDDMAEYSDWVVKFCPVWDKVGYLHA